MKRRVEDGCDPEAWLALGDFARFRYVDADSYDPEEKEIFHGIVVKVSWKNYDHEVMEYPSYQILTNGNLLWFSHYEIWHK